MSGKHIDKGLLAISPMILLLCLFLGLGIVAGDFYRVPLLVVFILVSAYALLITRSGGFAERIRIFSVGAGHPNLLQMLWIFIMAGAFAESATQMGAIDAMVNLTLSFLPEQMVLVGLFLASCLVSIGIGTSVGTIVAITPLASAMATTTGMATPMVVAAVVGGSFFGDNLSFISDTTVVATQTQQIQMKDKFLTNFRIALPVALITAIIYVVMGMEMDYAALSLSDINWQKILPYLFVLIAALCGMNVLIVLFTANLLTGIIGIFTGAYDVWGWMQVITQGIAGMGELILVSMIAGGLLELIRHNGGIDYLINHMRRHIRGPRGAALSIGALVSIVNCCTANNTIAILSTGEIARTIADTYGVSRQRTASLLDIFSCCTQGVLPYGAQLLMAAGIAAINPITIIPYLYYPAILLVGTILTILFIKDRNR